MTMGNRVSAIVFGDIEVDCGGQPYMSMNNAVVMI